MSRLEIALRAEIAELRQLLDDQATATAILRDRMRTMAKNIADDIAKIPHTKWVNPGMGFSCYAEPVAGEAFKQEAIAAALKHGE